MNDMFLSFGKTLGRSIWLNSNISISDLSELNKNLIAQGEETYE